MIKLICFTIFIFTVAFCNIDDRCLNCICQVESKCKAIGCKNDAGSLSCGYFQIKEAYYIDCGEPAKNPGDSVEDAWKRCAEDLVCAKQCVRAYEDRYAAKCHANPNCEVYARVHNGGPNGCKSNYTTAYWNKVKKCLG